MKWLFFPFKCHVCLWTLNFREPVKFEFFRRNIGRGADAILSNPQQNLLNNTGLNDGQPPVRKIIQDQTIILLSVLLANYWGFLSPPVHKKCCKHDKFTCICITSIRLVMSAPMTTRIDSYKSSVLEFPIVGYPHLYCTFSGMSIVNKFKTVFEHPFLLGKYVKIAFSKRRDQLYK